MNVPRTAQIQKNDIFKSKQTTKTLAFYIGYQNQIGGNNFTHQRKG